MSARPLSRAQNGHWSGETRNAKAPVAGERLLATIGPHFDEIEAGLAAFRELRDEPTGTIRVTASDYAAETVRWPALATFLPEYPDIHVEISVDLALRDIVAERFDAGINSGLSLILS